MSHAYCTNQGPFGCPVLSDPGVMLCAMPVTVRIDGLGELLDQQFSVASRGQLLDLGMKDNAMQWRVRPGGPWQALLPGVYLGLTGAPNLLQKEMAAQLYAGPGSLITGPVALMHHGLRSPVVLEMVDRAGAGRAAAAQHRLRSAAPDVIACPIAFVATGPVRLRARWRGLWRTPRGCWPRCGTSGLSSPMRCSGGGAPWLAWLRSSSEWAGPGLGDVPFGARGGGRGHQVDRRRGPARPVMPSRALADAFVQRDRCMRAMSSSRDPMRGGQRRGWQRKSDSYEWHLSPADADRTRLAP